MIKLHIAWKEFRLLSRPFELQQGLEQQLKVKRFTHLTTVELNIGMKEFKNI